MEIYSIDEAFLDLTHFAFTSVSMPGISGSREAEKLRHQESFAEELTVYVMTSWFKSDPYYYNSKTAVFPTASNNTPELIRQGKALLKQIFQSWEYYTKAGIFFFSLSRAGQVPLDLFDHEQGAVLEVDECPGQNQHSYGESFCAVCCHGAFRAATMERGLQPLFPGLRHRLGQLLRVY